MPQLTVQEQNTIDEIVRYEQKGAPEALATTNRKRRLRKVAEADKSTVYRYIRADTRKRCGAENRGRPESLSKQDKAKLEQTRKSMIKQADNEYQVTYHDILLASGASRVGRPLRLTPQRLSTHWRLLPAG